MAAPPINYEDPHLYEHLTLIIDEFEKAALRSGSRQGILVTAQAPLQGMDMILASADKALSMGRTANATRVSDEASGKDVDLPDQRAREFGDASTKEDPLNRHNDLVGVAKYTKGEVNIDGVGDGELGNTEYDIKGPSFEVGATGSIGFDADMNDLFGGEGDPEKRGDTIGDYLSQCLGCDLRLSFDWQLQPIDLLLPIGDLLADINAALDQFEGFLDPFGYLKDLCDLLNGLNIFCIPDLMMILLALKMLLKSYLTFQLSIRLDWTVLIGPLLKLILDAITTLIQQIAGLIVAPLDCAYSALLTIADFQDELAETAALAAAVAQRAADRATLGGPDGELDDFELTTDPRYKNVSPDSEIVDAKNDKLDFEIPSINTRTTTGGTAEFEAGEGISFPQGYQIKANTKLPEALRDPRFLRTNPFRKLALSVRDAKSYITDIVRKLLFALNSLQGLTSGSLGLSLGNLGLLLFLKDMINLVLLVVKMLRMYGDVKDWCSHLEENPAILERELVNTKVVASDESLLLFAGPNSELVGEVRTCFNERTPQQSALLKQWIADLKRAGSN